MTSGICGSEDQPSLRDSRPPGALPGVETPVLRSMNRDRQHPALGLGSKQPQYRRWVLRRVDRAILTLSLRDTGPERLPRFLRCSRQATIFGQETAQIRKTHFYLVHPFLWQSLIEIRSSAFISPCRQSYLRKSIMHAPVHEVNDNDIVRRNCI